MPKLKNDVEHSIEVKKSKFITYLHRTDSEDEARAFIKLVKKTHPDARHHCTALVIGPIVRSNDDGEPAGTAGHPMLDVLTSRGMTDIVAVVVRYFGGTLLGKGGLVRAYTDSVKLALEQASLVEAQTLQTYRIAFDYSLIGRFDAYFRTRGIEVISKDYQSEVVYHFCVKENIDTALNELASGRIQIDYVDETERESAVPTTGG